MIVDTIKSVFGSEPQGIEYECEECETTFNSPTSPESFWLECVECGSEEVTPADAA